MSLLKSQQILWAERFLRKWVGKLIGVNVVRLPDGFLLWNYYARRKLLEKMASGCPPENLLLEFARHTPVLCTAAQLGDGRVEVNGKVVGCGYVLKREHLREAIAAFAEHLRRSDEEYEEAQGDRRRLERLYAEHARRGCRAPAEVRVSLPGKSRENRGL